MSIFLETKQESYRAQRAASQGLGITLIIGAGYYHASFECAKRIAQILGDRELKEAGDGLLESIPVYNIPADEMLVALEKLSAKRSIALVELVCTGKVPRFVLVVKIPASRNSVQETPPPPVTLDDL